MFGVGTGQPAPAGPGWSSRPASQWWLASQTGQPAKLGSQPVLAACPRYSPPAGQAGSFQLGTVRPVLANRLVPASTGQLVPAGWLANYALRSTTTSSTSRRILLASMPINYPASAAAARHPQPASQPATSSSPAASQPASQPVCDIKLIERKPFCVFFNYWDAKENGHQ